MDIAGIRAPQYEDIIPTSWYNILPDLPGQLPPPLKPNGEHVKPEDLESIFPKSIIEQEMSSERYIAIPPELRRTYMEIGRPTPLFRAVNLEKYLGTPSRIYYKYEGVLPTGSHKINTALAQAYYNKVEGVKRLTTETGAGQWGSALALASILFGLKLRVYMVKISYIQKPYRQTVMRTYGAEVVPSPSDLTEAGRRILAEDPDNPGSLGIAISEAVEDAVSRDDTKYSLGSVLNHVLLHQTIIGLEAKKQVEELGVYPDVIVGAVGGGSNYAGIAYPFLYDKLKGRSETKFIAVEPVASPTMTRGERRYDYGDTAGLTPLLLMHTIGHRFIPPPIHAGGLRYHGLAPTLSLLVNHGYVEPLAYKQTEVFDAAVKFARLEGIIPAPESAHAVKAVMDLALNYREKGSEKVILFNLSGHGLLDLSGYQDYFDGKLADVAPENIDLSYLPNIEG
ncbi:MAG: TrpB-like pyridoxal phosphate-dependent enzyme [Desulfurococcales archaeon]|nr:TrpB-like pyridoxal phosphate-dependent enzyme [Desulfurococcales archaeon]